MGMGIELAVSGDGWGGRGGRGSCIAWSLEKGPGRMKSKQHPYFGRYAQTPHTKVDFDFPSFLPSFLPSIPSSPDSTPPQPGIADSATPPLTTQELNPKSLATSLPCAAHSTSHRSSALNTSTPPGRKAKLFVPPDMPSIAKGTTILPRSVPGDHWKGFGISEKRFSLMGRSEAKG